MLMLCSLLVTTTFAGVAPDLNDHSKSPPNVVTIDFEKTANDLSVVIIFDVLVPDDTEVVVPMVRIRKDFYELLLWHYYRCLLSPLDEEEYEEDEYYEKASNFNLMLPGRLPRGTLRC